MAQVMEPGTRLRAAVIGTGYLGRYHAQKYAAMPDAELVGVVDADAMVAGRVAEECHTRTFADYRALFGAVDVVSIATTTPAHHAIAAAFLRAGVHVLVEKPISATVAEAEELIDIARRQGRMLQVGHLERFNPAIVAAEPHLRSPRFIECQRIAPFRQRGTDVNVVLDLMIHDLDIVQSIVRSDIVSVDAVGSPVFSGEIDIANARIHFANGCVANATASRISMKTERKLRIFEDHAYLSLDLQQRLFTLIRKREPLPGETPPQVSIDEQSFEQGDALMAEIAAFLAACRGQGPVVVSGEDGLRALRLATEITRRVQERDA